MLGKLRNFSKSKFAGLLIAIIIIPFVFWGMGNVFSGGNTNSVAKINNENISTQDFIEYINETRLTPEILKENLDKNILQEILSQIISTTLLKLEINELGLTASDEFLFKNITTDKKFIDENGKFSRIKYEKFLLENNVSAISYEQKLKDANLQNNLFQYVSGGIRSPQFLTKNFYTEDTKEIEVNYINLEKIYKKNFTNSELDKFILENKDDLEKDYIDIIYAKIEPEQLVNSNDFSSEFFKTIDDIENDISAGLNLKNISSKYNIQLVEKNNFYLQNEEDEILKEIYSNRKGMKIDILDKENFFLIYEIKKIVKKLPSMDDKFFSKELLDKISSKEKFNYNKELLKKIENNDFKDEEFLEIGSKENLIEKLTIKSKNDNSFFNVDSLSLLYTIPKDDFLLIVDNEKNVYLTKVVNFNYKNFSNSSEEGKIYISRSNFRLKNNISNSYDDLLNTKYKVKINQNTLERLKNYFK